MNGKNKRVKGCWSRGIVLSIRIVWLNGSQSPYTTSFSRSVNIIVNGTKRLCFNSTDNH